MKKDIEIPKVTGVKLAIVQEYNTDFKSYDWNAYLINEKDKALDMVFIKISGSNKKQKTATMRHKIDKMPAQSVAKIEFIQDDVLKLNNSFNITFFLENQLFEKNFLVKKNTVQASTAQELILFNGSKGFVFE
jgi:hypothetical protein